MKNEKYSYYTLVVIDRMLPLRIIMHLFEMLHTRF